MGFNEREFDVYVVLGSSAASPPWVQSTWTAVSQALEPLIDAARDSPAIRSTQLRPGEGSPNKRGISFGRIGWDRRVPAKWTHSEDGTLLSGEPAHFLTCEVWAPSWTVCQRELRGPDVYFAISNESRPTGAGKEGSAAGFNSCCLLAVAGDLPGATSGKAAQAADALALLLDGRLWAHATRPWGSKREPGSLPTNAINDLITSGLFRPGPRQQLPVGVAMLNEGWTAF
jgi:hypothetical protein